MGWIEIIGIIGAIVTAMLGFLQSRQNKGHIAQVQVTVDGRYTKMSDRVDQLTASLTAAGIAVPPPTKDTATG
jgi:hypothetical protein